MDRKYFLLPLLLAFILPGLVFAQTGAVEGTVVDRETGEPLPGANVLIVGTHLGAATTIEGTFSIDRIPVGTHTLEARFLGYRSARMTVDVVADVVTEVTFEMAESALRFDDVVVTGQAREARRREVAATVTSIDTAPLAEAPITSMSQMLQARSPGILVQQGSGASGMGSRISLRGVTSLTQGVQPVIYVDGVRIDNSTATGVSLGGQAWTGLDDINWQDVERIEVIKGAAAATLYGTQAADGVIQLFTKGGTRETRPVSWTYQTQIGTESVDPAHLRPMSVYADWFVDEIMRPGFINQHQLSATGSVAGFNYYTSVTYHDRQGLYKTNAVDYFSARGNIQFLPREDFVIRLNQAYSERQVWAPQDGNNIFSYLGNGLYGGPRGDFFQTDLTDDYESLLKSMRYTGSLNAEYQPLESINLRATGGLEIVNTDNWEFIEFGLMPIFYPAGRKVNTRRHSTQATLELAAEYNTNITDAIRSDLTVGFQGFNHKVNWLQGIGEEFPFIGLETIGTAAITTSSESRTESREYGLFAQERLGFNDMVFLTLGMRADRHSAFGIDFGWGLYPSAGVSYVISDHDFWRETFGETEMRLRAQYGRAGRAPGLFDHLRTWAAISARDGQPAVTTANIGNPDLGPEVSNEFEFGFDLSVLRDRLSMEVTYYTQNTTDALLAVRYPPSEGVVATQLENVAEVQNDGIELAIQGRIIEMPNFSWGAGINMSFNENEIVSMADVPEATIHWGQRNRPGYPVGAFFADRLEYDAEGNVILVEDSADDPNYIGPAFPTRQIQISNNMTLLRRLNVNVLFDHAGGHYSYTNTMFFAALIGVAPDDPVLGEEYWGKPVWPRGHEIHVERERLIEAGQDPNDIYNYEDPLWAAWALGVPFQREDGTWTSMPEGNQVLKGDYWRLREVQVSYTLPERWIRGFGLRNASISFTGRNLWRDVDPMAADTEVNYDTANQYAQQEFLISPLPRTYIFGLRVNF